MHQSIAIASPEFINIQTISPLVSRCEIKVCYVGDDPNRNRTVITKEVAREMAGTLPGSPIVGKYNHNSKDYEEHNKIIRQSGGDFIVEPDTTPYGFVPTDAKVWFQKFLDDGENEREYLVTEGVLWTGAFAEAQRIIDKGNNQSMELDEKSFQGNWANYEKGGFEIFILSSGTISKLCILGEEFEPCFEGSQIKKLDFALDETLVGKMYTMISDFNEAINIKGGQEEMEDNTVIEGTIEGATAPEGEFLKLDKPVGKPDEEETPKSEVQVEDASTEETPAEDKKKKYSVEEYSALETSLADLQTEFNAVKQELEEIRGEYSRLVDFEQKSIETEKDSLISGFYMLSDEDKQDVIANKANYSLEDIEAKLSILCVRKKVNFSVEEESQPEVQPTEAVVTYGLDQPVSSVPEWVKRVASKQENQ